MFRWQEKTIFAWAPWMIYMTCDFVYVQFHMDCLLSDYCYSKERSMVGLSSTLNIKYKSTIYIVVLPSLVIMVTPTTYKIGISILGRSWIFNFFHFTRYTCAFVITFQTLSANCECYNGEKCTLIFVFHQSAQCITTRKTPNTCTVKWCHKMYLTGCKVSSEFKLHYSANDEFALFKFRFSLYFFKPLNDGSKNSNS